MGECRNCGSTVLEDVGPIGEVAPFVLKRVFHLENGIPPASHPVKRFFRRSKVLRHVFLRLFQPAVLVELQICSYCSFLQTKIPLPDAGLHNLYVDYRSESYNRERAAYEPSYAELAKYVGIGKEEVRNRVAGITAWLGPKFEGKGNLSMLDYGGADGKFLPNLPGVKYVFDISDTVPVSGITKVDSEGSLGTYSYVQLAHILEHVSYPLAFTRHVSSFIERGGYLYVEVPQEVDEVMLAQLRKRNGAVSVIIHEHINKFTPQSITALIGTSGLHLLDIKVETFDFGWIQCPIIRALAQKNP